MNVFLYASNFKKFLNWNRIITFEVDKIKSHAIIKTITAIAVLYRVGNFPQTFMEEETKIIMKERHVKNENPDMCINNCCLCGYLILSDT